MKLLCPNICHRLPFLALTALAAMLWSGCFAGKEAPVTGPGTRPAASNGDPLRFDPLRVGDGIRIDFSGTPSPLPSVQTEIKGDGTVRLDFIGDVAAADKTPGELERVIQTAYVPQYYTHLNVTVTPTVRYFYVQGEVNGGAGGGRIPYSGPITVTRAIAAAGDFNPYADRKHVKLYRVNASSPITVNCLAAEDNPRLDPPVYPGDRIFVKKRLW